MLASPHHGAGIQISIPARLNSVPRGITPQERQERGGRALDLLPPPAGSFLRVSLGRQRCSHSITHETDGIFGAWFPTRPSRAHYFSTSDVSVKLYHTQKQRTVSLEKSSFFLQKAPSASAGNPDFRNIPEVWDSKPDLCRTVLARWGSTLGIFF